MSFFDKLFSFASAFSEAAERAQKQQERKMSKSSSYQKGRSNNKTTIVLSAPGQAEEEAGRPAAGQTGKNINGMLKAANKKDPKTFPSANKDDYTITQASSKVEYKSKTGRTEASSREINDPTNLRKVKDNLKGAKTVVALGSKANEAVKKAGFRGEIISGSHPSNQNLNRNFQSNKETPSERHDDRLDQYTNELLKARKKTK